MKNKGSQRTNQWVRTVLLSGLVFFFVSMAFTAAFAQQKKRIAIGGAMAGGTQFPMAVGMADVINRHLPEYNAIALETGGSLENIRLLGKGEVEIILANARDSKLGYNGEKPFTTPLKNLRAAVLFGNAILHVVALDRSKIRTIEDLKGKVVNVGAPGSIVAATTEALLRLHNLSLKDLKLRHMGASESIEALGDGLIDASVLYSAIPAPAVNTLAVTKKIHLVTANQKFLEAAVSKESIVPLYVPPESYKGQSEGAYVWAVAFGTYYNEATSVDDVYKWTKAIIEHRDEIQKVHPQGKELRLMTKKESEISALPLHQGVIKYAKEKGINY